MVADANEREVNRRIARVHKVISMDSQAKPPEKYNVRL